MKIENLAKSPKLLKSLLKQGYSIGEAAEKLNLDFTLAWAMALEELDDLQRLKTLDEKVKLLYGRPIIRKMHFA